MICSPAEAASALVHLPPVADSTQRLENFDALTSCYFGAIIDLPKRFYASMLIQICQT